MALLDLPTDVLLLVADEIESEHDISSFTKTCRHLNNIRYFNSSALFWGARHNRLDTIDRMLHLGADVNSTEDDQTVLELSACEGRTAVVKFVLGRGASDGFTEGHPRTPLCAAAAEGHDDVVKILLDHDESKQQQDIPALLNQLFPTRGLNTQGKGVRYSIPLFMAIAGSHDATGDILIKNKNIDLNYRDSFQRTPLLWALSHGRDRIVSSLLSHGADGNLEDPSTRQSPLLTAVSQGNERALKLLLRYASVDPNWRDGQQRSPLFEALRPRRNLPLLRPLVGRSDLDVNRRGSEGLTPLCFAVRSGDIEVVELLLGHPGIDVHGTCAAGRTALSYAANSRRVQLVDLLLARGADPSHPDLDGRVAASYAAEADAR
ncbi:ankyrin repeat-containing domain protein [Aspergillus cavernicola]|uniref:Ankyrin repeat-containing domain protein n=1 Tax=Aspergillus cavernicola TaxID=176166 RepID=A0ABR4IHP1_9EURO